MQKVKNILCSKEFDVVLTSIEQIHLQQGTELRWCVRLQDPQLSDSEVLLAQQNLHQRKGNFPMQTYGSVQLKSCGTNSLHVNHVYFPQLNLSF